MKKILFSLSLLAMGHAYAEDTITVYAAASLTNVLAELDQKYEKKNNEYYMYKQINVPGVLIETGFLSNPDDRYLLQSEEYQEKLVKYITDGIVCYFS